jgi:NAD(P)-dependent dehydrogenase (short-subunit alcohol dehydrogenase family)
VQSAAESDQAFAPVLADNGGGALVNIHSVASWLGGMGGYGDSKAAIWAGTNSSRIELEKQGTLVTGVHLGYTDTEMFGHVDAPKTDPRQMAREIVDGIERGDAEVLADECQPPGEIGSVRPGRSAPNEMRFAVRQARVTRGRGWQPADPHRG